VEQLLNQGDKQSATLEQSPVSLPEGLTKDHVIRVSSGYRKAFESGTSEKRKDVEIFHQLFDGKLTNQIKSKNTAFISVVSSIVDTLASRVSKAIWGRDKLVDVIPETLNQTKDQAKIVEEFVNQQLIYSTRGQQRAKSIIRACIIEGAGFYKDYWKVCKEKQIVPEYKLDPMSGKPLYSGDELQELEYGEWSWCEVAPGDAVYDPAAKSWQESPYVGFRSVMTLNELREWAEQGKIDNIEAIEKITPSGVSDREDWEKKRNESKINGVNNSNDSLTGYLVDDWHGCISWQCQCEDGTKKTMVQEFHWIIVENEILAKFEEPNLVPERKPGGAFPFGIDPRKVWGKSGLANVKPLQELINTFAGKQIDLVDQVANRPVYYDYRAGKDAKTWLQRTQGLIPVENVEGVKEGSTDPSAVTINQGFLNFLITFSRDMTAATEQAQGLSTGDMTATEFQGLAQMVGSRMEDIVDNLFQFWIAPMGASCLAHYAQFGIDGQMIVRESSIDGEPKSVTRDMLAGKWRVVPASGQSEANKLLRQKEDREFLSQMIAFNQAAMANPMQTGNMIYNLGKHIEEISLPLRDQRNVKDFFEQLPPPVPPAALAAQMTAQGGTPGGIPLPPGVGA
jgi:hypothetical protein